MSVLCGACGARHPSPADVRACFNAHKVAVPDDEPIAEDHVPGIQIPGDPDLEQDVLGGLVYRRDLAFELDPRWFHFQRGLAELLIPALRLLAESGYPSSAIEFRCGGVPVELADAVGRDDVVAVRIVPGLRTALMEVGSLCPDQQTADVEKLAVHGWVGTREISELRSLAARREAMFLAETIQREAATNPHFDLAEFMATGVAA